MAASTKRFTLTSLAYVDVSEGATLVYFVLDFVPNSYRAVRLALGQALPSASTIHYQSVNPSAFPVAGDNFPQEVPIKFELGSDDALYVRAENEDVVVVVHRL